MKQLSGRNSNRIDDYSLYSVPSPGRNAENRDLMLTECEGAGEGDGHRHSVSQEARDFLLKRAMIRKYGARPLGEIQRNSKNRLRNLFLEGRFKKGKGWESAGGRQLLSRKSRPEGKDGKSRLEE